MFHTGRWPAGDRVAMTTDPVVGGLVLRPGVRLVVGEHDYLFGVGPVEIVVRHVQRVVWYADEEWVELTVVQVMTCGATVGRFIAVRVAALRAAVRPD
jgi:hypothetical protein